MNPLHKYFIKKRTVFQSKNNLVRIPWFRDFCKSFSGLDSQKVMSESLSCFNVPSVVRYYFG